MPALVVIISVLFLGTAGAVEASHVDREQQRLEREQRSAERDAERALRRAEREAEQIAREEKRNQEEVKVPTCTCRASISFSRPQQLTFLNNILTFKPRLDLRISSRGDADAPMWQANMLSSGRATFSSGDIATPPDSNFEFNNSTNEFPCGTTYNHSGLALGGVSLSGVMRTLLGFDKNLKGTIIMSTTLTIPSCQLEEMVMKQFSFSLTGANSARLGSWRSVR